MKRGRLPHAGASERRWDEAYRQHRSAPSAPRQPVAVAVHKMGRGSAGDGWCIVGKLTQFIGEREPILAVAWRAQQGTRAAISMPTAALDYARRQGASRFYLRDDRHMRMWTCDLASFDRGKLQADGERYIPLSWLTETPWRPWRYAKAVVRLGDDGPQHVQQLPLFADAIEGG